MNSKIHLVVSIILFTINSSLAQEKQNDATWEETINFLEEHVPRLDFRDASGGLSEFRIENNVFTAKRHYDQLRFEKANLKNLTGIADGGKYLYFEENSVEIDTSRRSSIDFLVWRERKSLSDLDKRVIKAFTHLAYLAEEKRKESKF